MRVRATQSFLDETARREQGDVFEVSDSIGIERIKAGLVVRVEDEPERAVTDAPETAVLRGHVNKGRRRRK